MKKIFVFTAISLVFFIGFSLNPVTSSFSQDKIISPVSKLISQNISQKKPANILSQTSSNPDLDLQSKSILAVDLTNNKVIYQKNPRQKQPIASLAKVMTAAVALEHSVIENLVTIKKDCRVGESEIGLEEGEKLTVNELIYGLLLPSGNDAAEALATGVGKNRKQFISWMNQKANDLKMKDTHFVNPSGLDEEPPQKSSYSTAYDLYLLTTYALNFPYLRKVFATDSITFPKNYRRKAYIFNNRLFMHQYYAYIKGIKPGYTEQAGNCLISLAEKDGKEVLAIFLDSKDPKKDALTLFTYVFKD